MRCRGSRVVVRLPAGRPELGGQRRPGGPQVGHLARLDREPALRIGEGLALVADDSDQLVAGGLGEIEHGAILRLRCLAGNPSPHI